MGNKLKIGIVSLGCDKNRVDTENMLAIINKNGYEIINQADNADVIIVNTCAFVNDAKKESINTILEMAEFKKTGNCKKLIVTGCLPQRYKGEIAKLLPEVDGFIGTGNYEKIIEAIESANNYMLENDINCTPKLTDRYLTTSNYAYLKISEGCDNFCTFCAIPQIRGKFRSNLIESLVSESKQILDNGCSELILVAQNLTDYGKDLNGDYNLLKLLDSITKLDFKWVRLMYCYPEQITSELIKYVSQNPKLCKYLDIPLQHIDDKILKLMNRKTSTMQVKNLVNSIREIDDKIAIRSSFIVGFPQEGETEFNNLSNFIAEYKLNHCGFFTYSKEEGTPASKLNGQVLEKIKKERQKQLYAVQTKVALEKNSNVIGNVQEILYEGIDFAKQRFYGRNMFNAPDIDDKVLFKSSFQLEIGKYYNVKITGQNKLNLIGEVV